MNRVPGIQRRARAARPGTCTESFFLAARSLVSSCSGLFGAGATASAGSTRRSSVERSLADARASCGLSIGTRKLRQVSAITALDHAITEFDKLLRVDPALTERDLFGTADLEALSLLECTNE